MTEDSRTPSGLGRRQFLESALASAAAGIALQAGMEGAMALPAGAQTALSPDAALNELMAGNERFAANKLVWIAHDLDVLKERTVEKQEPFAALLSCADSRVPVELVFDQTIGHLF